MRLEVGRWIVRWLAAFVLAGVVAGAQADALDTGPVVVLLLGLTILGVLATIQFVSYLNRDVVEAPPDVDVIDKANEKMDETEAFMERIERLKRQDDDDDAQQEDQK